MAGKGSGKAALENFDASLLIKAGSALYIIAFLIREELTLRLTIVAGTILYIFYYLYFPDPPLWDAIIASVIMIFANLIVLGQIVLERTTFRLNPEAKELFDAFETLTPGQFRHILRLAEWKVSEGAQGTVLTHEAEPSGSLFYVFRGAISVEKSGRWFTLPEGNFVGEIAYVLKRETTATTTAPPGVEYVQWNTDALRKLSKKKPNLGNALNALLTRDLAKKLSSSYRPDVATPRDQPPTPLTA